MYNILLISFKIEKIQRFNEFIKQNKTEGLHTFRDSNTYNNLLNNK